MNNTQSKNKPNKLKVVYRKWEGDSRAGSWMESSINISTLDDLPINSKIVSVTPFYQYEEYFEPLTQNMIYEAISAKKAKNQAKRESAELKRAEAALKRAQDKVYS